MSQSPESQVMMMLGCSEEEAHKYLQEAGGDVLKAVEKNLNVPCVSGEKYLPPPPAIDDGLDPEVREKLKKAREYADLLSTSFRNDLRGTQSSQASGEHVQQEPEEEEEEEQLPELAVGVLPQGQGEAASSS